MEETVENMKKRDPDGLADSQTVKVQTLDVNCTYHCGITHSALLCDSKGTIKKLLTFHFSRYTKEKGGE